MFAYEDEVFTTTQAGGSTVSMKEVLKSLSPENKKILLEQKAVLDAKILRSQVVDAENDSVTTLCIVEKEPIL